MKQYWSSSKFADWLRGTPKPLAGTAEEWRDWEMKAKKKKYRYWLAEEGLDYLEEFVYWPANRVNDVRCYINNRWITRSHSLTSNLKRGRWYDLDTRLLHAVFDELVNFVEIELAWKLVVCSEEDRKKYKTPWYRMFLRMGRWRSPEAGLAYLQWASDLKADEDWLDKNDPGYGQPTHQALAAQEIVKLYTWWKVDRPKRPAPGDFSGWNKYCEENRKNASNADSFEFISTKMIKDKRSDHILNLYHQMEKEHEDEDTAMLIRLIKIRQSLWT